jgi:nucleoside-diphosphate-sugar epimerase
MAGDALPIYGDGSQQRDYIYIEDAAAALLQLGATPAANGRVYNVGSGIGTRLVDMARAIIDIAGSGRLEFMAWPALAEQIETGDFVASIDRIGRDIGWRPRVGLADGLKRTIAHYKSQVTSLK